MDSGRAALYVVVYALPKRKIWGVSFLLVLFCCLPERVYEGKCIRSNGS